MDMTDRERQQESDYNKLLCRHKELQAEYNNMRNEMNRTQQNINTVNVRWFDGYLETFEASEVRFGNTYLWMQLVDGQNRHISLHQVRWFSLSIESHARKG